MQTMTHSHHEHHSVLLEWEAPEFMPIPRGKIWYIAAGAVTLALLAYALLSDNMTMAAVILLLAVVLALTHKNEPREMTVIITDLGVHYGRQFFPYHHINAFYVVYHPPYVRALYLRLKLGRHFKLLKIELNHQKPQEVRQILLKEVPEIEGGQEPISDLLARLLRL